MGNTINPEKFHKSSDYDDFDEVDTDMEEIESAINDHARCLEIVDEEVKKLALQVAKLQPSNGASGDDPKTATRLDNIEDYLKNHKQAMDDLRKKVLELSTSHVSSQKVVIHEPITIGSGDMGVGMRAQLGAILDPIKVVPDTTVTLNTLKARGENKMDINFGKIFGTANIGKLNSERFKLSMLGLAIMDENRKYMTYDAASETLTDVAEFVIGAQDMIYALPVAHVVPGDLILRGDKPFYVKAVTTNGKLTVVNPLESKEETLMPQKNIYGFNFYVKVVSMFNMDGTQPDQNNPFGGMFPALMMAKDSDTDMGEIMMLSAMSGGSMNMKSMFPFMFLGKGKGGDSDMTKIFMLSAMMGGGDGMGVFGNMFGQTAAPALTAAPAPVVKAPTKKPAAKKTTTTKKPVTDETKADKE